MEMRDVQVLMIGGVETVGIFTLPGGSNFFYSALNAAGGISDWIFRRIEHKRNGGDSKFDLYDIFVNAEFGFSTTLRTGDIFCVRQKLLKYLLREELHTQQFLKLWMVKLSTML